MSLIEPPLPPMEARSVDEIPIGDEWQYEPKWAGFRCIAFRDQTEIYLQSKAGQPLARYFPDIAEGLEQLRSRNFVLDGELAVPVGGALSFDELQLRLHPAASRVHKLATAHPALFVIFDLLGQDRQEHRTNRGMGAGQPKDRCRSCLRSFHGWQISTRHKISSLALGQSAASMHPGSGRESRG